MSRASRLVQPLVTVGGNGVVVTFVTAWRIPREMGDEKPRTEVTGK